MFSLNENTYKYRKCFALCQVVGERCLLQEEQQRIKNARHAKLENLATELVNIIKDQELTAFPSTWDETDGDWVHEHLLETGHNFGEPLNAQGIYLTGMYERKGVDTQCVVDTDYADKVVLTVVLDMYNPDLTFSP